MKFKVGDTIRGKKNNGYAYTNELMLEAIVIKVVEPCMKIKILRHVDVTRIGKEYTVSNQEEYFELIKKFETSDLKDGDIITYRNGKQVIVVNSKVASFELYNNDLTHKSNKNYDIVKIEHPSNYQTVFERKEEILDKAEKRYLRDVIRPFRDKVKSIYKHKRYYDESISYICICLENDNIYFPDFETNTMYKKMETNKKYKLEELGL